MRILQINSVCGQGSTGRICLDIANILEKNGHEAYIAYAFGSSDYPKSFNFSGSMFDYYIHNFLSRLTDSEGQHSKSNTKRLLNWIDSISPNIIHLHTLHGHYINYIMLLDFLIEKKIPIIITLHDCWTFTGRCAHFDMIGCNKWKEGCINCKFLSEYPQSWFIDRARHNFKIKESLFTRLKDRLTIVPVSFWLESFVKESFLKDTKIKTIHNGIDLKQFKPTHNASLMDKYKIIGDKIILGVASPWSKYKGLDDFYKLRQKLGKEYVIVLVGLSKKQIDNLPKGIIGISRTNNIKQLAELYTIADVLVNPTYCDNYPTVNLESIACGTPVITYNTGGSPEAIDEKTGLVVNQGDINGLAEAIIKIVSTKKSDLSEHCRDRAIHYFDNQVCFLDYLKLYLSASVS